MEAGIYIDDAGTPGTESLSAFLHSQRKSWAGVIVPEASIADTCYAMDIFLRGVKEDYKAIELHFSDIYGGRGTFGGVPIGERFELIKLMVGIFNRLQLPILFQTLSPEFFAELRSRSFPVDGKIGFFHLSNYTHVALLLLLFKVKRFMLEHRQHFPHPIKVFVDEGVAAAGVTFDIPGYESIFLNGTIQCAKSHEIPFLQLADFAAFAIARSQWLQGRGKLKDRDKRFLELIFPLHCNVMNLPSFTVNPDEICTETYDAILVADRRLKGLPDYPEKTH